MMIDQRKIKLVYNVAGNHKCRTILRSLSTGPKTYTDLMAALGYKVNPIDKTKSNNLAHVIKRLGTVHLISHNKRGGAYFITELGQRIFSMFDEFEKFYMYYTMSDVDENGMVPTINLVRMRSQ